MATTQKESLEEMRTIPGIGKVLSADLYKIGYRKVADLQGENPEVMYKALSRSRGSLQDPCVLYTMRCAVYYANTFGRKQDPKKLLWWNWKE